MPFLCLYTNLTFNSLIQIDEYLRRAEALKAALKGQQQGDGGSANGGASATATGARTKGKEVS